MLSRWLTRLEPVHIARTREEREALYRFRYTVYYEEFGRALGSPDHEQKRVTDDDDEKESTTLLYTGRPEQITGTVRIRHWGPGEVPDSDFRGLSMDTFPDIDQRHTGEIERMVVGRTMRGKLVLASLVRRLYDLFCGEYGTDLLFCYCSPGLVHHYRKLGMRPFGGRLVHAPDGVMIPLVGIPSDTHYLRKVGSPLAPVARRHFGRGKRPVLDIGRYRELLESDTAPIEADAEIIWGAIQDAITDVDHGTASFLEGLPADVARELTSKGFLLRVTADTMMTRKGFGEEEMYLILDGLFEATDGDRRLRVMSGGELFGELAFFLPGHRRTATVRAVTDGRLLILRASSLRRLIDENPTVAARLLQQIGTVMADRLASATGVSDD